MNLSEDDRALLRAATNGLKGQHLSPLAERLHRLADRLEAQLGSPEPTQCLNCGAVDLEV